MDFPYKASVNLNLDILRESHYVEEPAWLNRHCEAAETHVPLFILFAENRKLSTTVRFYPITKSSFTVARKLVQSPLPVSYAPTKKG